MIDQAAIRLERCDVTVVGAGPAGLAAATALRQRGIDKVVVIERDTAAGGIPRHCGHPPFGMREFHRILTGPSYARRLVATAREAGVELRTGTSVASISQGGKLLLTDGEGIGQITAKRVIIATGVREASCAARLVSGGRLLGIYTTGALQAMVYLKGLKPFQRPVIVGSELVSFSAILTCRKAGIRPVVMIEENDRVTARWPCQWLPRIRGIPLNQNTRLVRIEGEGRVSQVIVADRHGGERAIDCDGVLFTGGFTPEASLARCGHLQVDAGTGGPVVDQFGRCSDPTYFAAGNLLRPVETAGWSWREGQQVGGWVADDLSGKLSDTGEERRITPVCPLIKLAVPHTIKMQHGGEGMTHVQLRFTRPARGKLVARNGSGIVWRRHLRALPERRVLIPLAALAKGSDGGLMKLDFEESS